MDDYQIADEKAILKLNEEYRKLKLNALGKVKTMSVSTKNFTKQELKADEIFCLRSILKALELEKDLLLNLNGELNTKERGISEGLNILQNMLTKLNKLMSLIVLPCSFSRTINDTHNIKIFYQANLDLVENTNKLLSENTNLKLNLTIKYIQQKQLQLFSIILPYLI